MGGVGGAPRTALKTTGLESRVTWCARVSKVAFALESSPPGGRFGSNFSQASLFKSIGPSVA